MAFPGGGTPPFDFSALQQALSDPSIKQMAEQIATDPAFMGLTKQLQESMSGMMGAPGAEAAAAAAPDPASFDPAKYMQAMSSMFQNQGFMQMAEKLGQAIISSDPNMQQMMSTMQDPEYKGKVEEAMKNLKTDPELGPLFEELEGAGPAAMMKYWNDPEVLSKISKAMGGAFELPEGEGGEGEEEEEEGEEEEELPNVHSAASGGDVEQLKQLLETGSAVDEADEEGRTALHFAAGYGELECVQALIDASANLDLKDNNSNTALHYAAGYGQAASVKLLLDSGADKGVLNADGKTALEVAQLNDQAEVAAVLAGKEE